MAQDRGTFWQKISGFAKSDKAVVDFSSSQLPARLRNAGSSPLEVQRKKDYFIRCQELRALRRLMQQKSWAESDSVNSRHTAPASALSRDETLRRITEIEAAFHTGTSTAMRPSGTKVNGIVMPRLSRPPIEMFAQTDAQSMQQAPLASPPQAHDAGHAVRFHGAPQGLSGLEVSSETLRQTTLPATQQNTQQVADAAAQSAKSSEPQQAATAATPAEPSSAAKPRTSATARSPASAEANKAVPAAALRPATDTASSKTKQAKDAVHVNLPGQRVQPSPQMFAATQIIGMGGDLSAIRNRTVDEAAAAYSKGDDAGARRCLEDALKPGAPLERHHETWKTYFDLLRLLGDAPGFSREARRYVALTAAPFPRWSYKSPAPAAQPSKGMVSPAELDAMFASNLFTGIGLASPQRGIDLDFSGLRRIRSAGFEPLLRALKLLASFTGEIRVQGADTLLEALADATPPGEKEIDPTRWEARLMALRLLNREVDYEFAGLDFAATFNVSPPPYKASSARISLKTATTAAGLGQAQLGLRLSGSITGARREFLAPLASVENMQGSIEISLQELERMDYPSAVLLRDWTRNLAGQGKEVSFSSVNRMVAILFSVVGVTSYAQVRLLDP